MYTYLCMCIYVRVSMEIEEREKMNILQHVLKSSIIHGIKNLPKPEFIKTEHKIFSKKTSALHSNGCAHHHAYDTDLNCCGNNYNINRIIMFNLLMQMCYINTLIIYSFFPCSMPWNLIIYIFGLEIPL